MSTTTRSRPLEQTLAAIEALDLAPIKFKATRPEDGYGWSPQYADRMEVAYKRYLILHAKYPEMTLAPEQDVDRFWHLHILDTRKYAADCEATFGHFLHHYPYLGLRGEEDAKALDDAFAAMQRLYLEEFGEPMSAVKNDSAWCSADVPVSGARSAWCTPERSPDDGAAWGALQATPASHQQPPAGQAAWCSVEATVKAAWCALEPSPTQALNENGERIRLH